VEGVGGRQLGGPFAVAIFIGVKRFLPAVQRLWQIPLLQLIRAIVRRKEYVAGKCLGQFFHEGFLHLGLVLTVAEIEICF
jgi:hypothetical protein